MISLFYDDVVGSTKEALHEMLLTANEHPYTSTEMSKVSDLDS